MNKESKYIDVHWQGYKKELIFLEASLGTGKTTQIEKIYYQLDKPKILYITSSTQLAEQTAKRFPFMYSYLDTDGTTRKQDINLRLKCLAINYHSLHKLSRDYHYEYDVLIIDEPSALYSSTCTNKLQTPNYRNNNELEYRIRTTPMVVFMGGEIPKYIEDEIKIIAENRPKDLSNKITKIEHKYPIDRNIRVEFVYNQRDRNALIGLQMAKREKRRQYLLKETENEQQKDDDFFLIEEDWSTADEINKLADQRERNRIVEPKGVLITTEYGEATGNLRETWQNEYPELKIIDINAKNVADYQEILHSLSEKDTYTDIDMLILSPTWSTGINIENEFDLIVGDYARNTNIPLTEEEIYQALHRERNPQHIIIQISSRDMGSEFNAFSRAKEEAKDIYELIEQQQNEYISKTYLTRQSDGAVRPDIADIKLYERALNVNYQNLLGRTLRLNQVWKRFKENGADIKNWELIKEHYNKEQLDEYQEAYLRNPKYIRDMNEQRLLGLEKHNDSSRLLLERICKQLNIQETESLTKEQYEKWDFGKIDENKKRNWELDNSPKLDKLALKRANLVNQIIGMFTMINTITNEKILTSEMIIDTDIYREIKENKDQYKQLLESFMTLDIPAMTVKEKDTELLLWIEEILRKYYFKVSYSNGGCKADYKKAMKEHNADFQKWKKAYRQELNIEGYLRYEDYLFIGLRDKTLQWRKLGKETKKFLQTFPHLRLTHYKEEFAPC